MAPARTHDSAQVGRPSSRRRREHRCLPDIAESTLLPRALDIRIALGARGTGNPLFAAVVGGAWIGNPNLLGQAAAHEGNARDEVRSGGLVEVLRPSLLALAFLVSCSAPPGVPGVVASPAADEQWRLAGPHVALLGRPTGVAFERDGPVVATIEPRSIRVEARCVNCTPEARLEIDLASPVPPYELGPGVAEAIVARGIVFPAEGEWTFEPLGSGLRVRSPTSTEPPVVILTNGSAQLAADCGTSEVATVVADLARAFNEADAAGLARVLREPTDFSMTGEPLETFATHSRDEVASYALARTSAGQRWYPYLVQAGAHVDNSIDLAVYLVRQAPDLPSANGYRRVFAGSRLACRDLRLVRFNAAVLSD